MCICVCHMCAGALGGKKRVSDPRAGVTGGCELSDMGAGSRTLVFWKSGECS